MGRPYDGEMNAMRGTYEWAMSSDVGTLTDFAAAAVGSPLYAVGTGGSLTAATLAAALHHDTGSAAEALTPLAFLDRERLDCSAASVLLFTAGGANVDMLAALDRAVALRPATLCLVCMSPRSKAARVVSRARGARLQAARVPAGRDGFLATNSLIAMSVWACRAYGEAGLSCCGGFPKFDSLVGDETENTCIGAALRKCPTLVILHDSWGRIAAVDLESKMVESGLASVQVADYRHFAHGRHNWLDKRLNSSVVALVSPGCERLASATLRQVPDEVPMISIETPFDGPIGSLALLAKAMRFVGALGKALGIDPGKPRVATFGRQLYALRYKPPPLGGATAIERIALCRKFGTDREAGPGTRRLRNLRSFVNMMMQQKFGGIVFDYDGTLVDTQDRRRLPKPAVNNTLTALLSSNIIVCVATGRGKSAGDALRRAIPKEYWPRTLIGYYNGADVGPLDDVGIPDRSGPVDPTLDEFLSAEAHKKESVGIKRTVRPHQITYESKKLSMADITRYLASIVSHTNKKVKIVTSAHSIDVIAVDTTKSVLIDCAKSAIKGGLEVLCMGDMGKWPGNDYELLSHPYSLSVDEVSGNAHTCWNLLPVGILGAAGATYYMERFKTNSGFFRIGEIK